VIDFLEYYKNQGYVFGSCMSRPDTNLMFINIPKNASSWTKSNLIDQNWEFYNYHNDNLYHKHSIVVLRDPIERWLSGISEYMFLYHQKLDPAHLSNNFFELIFDRIAFDDHTESQVLFLQNINLNDCTFFLCNNDYKNNFLNFLDKQGMVYSYYENQNVTAHNPIKSQFKNIFSKALENSKYKYKLEQYFEKDYNLINSVKFYAR
jgi:hypothetical protein